MGNVVPEIAALLAPVFEPSRRFMISARVACRRRAPSTVASGRARVSDKTAKALTQMRMDRTNMLRSGDREMYMPMPSLSLNSRDSVPKAAGHLSLVDIQVFDKHRAWSGLEFRTRLLSSCQTKKCSTITEGRDIDLTRRRLLYAFSPSEWSNKMSEIRTCHAEAENSSSWVSTDRICSTKKSAWKRLTGDVAEGRRPSNFCVLDPIIHWGSVRPHSSTTDNLDLTPSTSHRAVSAGRSVRKVHHRAPHTDQAVKSAVSQNSTIVASGAEAHSVSRAHAKVFLVVIRICNDCKYKMSGQRASEN